MYRQFNIQQFYVLPHTAVFKCFVWIWEQTAIISLYNIHWLVFVTEIWSLRPSGHYMYHQFNIQQFYVLPTQLYLSVLCGSDNKQPLFPYTTFTDWFLSLRFNPLQPSGHYMYHQFNIQ